MKNSICILILLSAIIFSSCDSAHTEIADWGKTKSYSDFGWNHYIPVKMEQTLVLDFNDDAQKFFTGNVVFELALKNDDGRLLPTQDILLYKNGVICENNRMSINKDDNEIIVGIEFDHNMPEGCYTLFLNPIDNGGIDRIEQIDLQNGFNVQKIEIMNPLAKKTIWSAIIIVILFVGWIIVSRIVNPGLKFSRISFDYNDGTGEISHHVGNCYKIICTNKPQKISLLHRIFVGNVYVEVNEFWTSELTILCGSRDAIRLITRGDYMLPDEAVRKETFSIQDDQHRKVNIETT